MAGWLQEQRGRGVMLSACCTTVVVASAEPRAGCSELSLSPPRIWACTSRAAYCGAVCYSLRDMREGRIIELTGEERAVREPGSSCLLSLAWS